MLFSRFSAGIKRIDPIGSIDSTGMRLFVTGVYDQREKALTENTT
jgi:hypothetical protein